MSGKLILVTATRQGFYEQLRKPGDVFEIANEKDFSERWMVKGSHASKREPVDLKKAARAESLAAGGPNAALTIALKDLADANALLAEKDARIAELEGKLAELSVPVVDDAPLGDGDPDELPPAPVGGTGPQVEPATPVQRVRRTPPGE